MEPSLQELAQLAHYEQIGSEYDLHYGDPSTILYRDRFFHTPMFDQLQIKGMRGLDAMCGAGHLSTYLEARGVQVTGLDFSPTQIAAYKRLNPKCDAVCGSIRATLFAAESFDLVAVVGGLHHLQAGLDEALHEIHRILKPGGVFCFSEPHTASLMDWLRRKWYRRDPLFEASEEAIDVQQLKRRHSERFVVQTEVYVGNLAYIGVLNSMILRIPVAWKARYAPALMAMEAQLNRIVPSWLACCVVTRWRKR